MSVMIEAITALERQASPGGVKDMAGVIREYVDFGVTTSARKIAQALVAAGYVKAPSVEEMADDIFEHVGGDGFGGVDGRYEAAQAILNRMRGEG